MAYTGYTSETPKSLLLDAGAFFKNYEVGTDTFDTAVANGKLIGATAGGGMFSAIPTIRQIEIDGIKGAAKGLQTIDGWVVMLQANVKEVSKEVILMSLASAEETNETNYMVLEANNYIELTDYMDNVTWVGKLSGTNDPVIIQVKNALATNGLTLNVADSNEAVVQLTFSGHYDELNLDNPPFTIYYPKPITNTATVDGGGTFSKAAPADRKFSITSSGGAKCGGVRLGTYPLASTQFTISGNDITIKKEYLTTLTNGDHVFTLLMDKGNNVTAPKITVGA